jgi:[glutamine synthetase] adenylyltransferase / [glutamine synthetase]-adenylyl-L-tyrosine phosphorylase
MSLALHAHAAPRLRELIDADPATWAAIAAWEARDAQRFIDDFTNTIALDHSDDASFKRSLHATRVALAYRIAAIEMRELLPLEATLNALSRLADVLIASALARVQHALTIDHGEPRNPSGRVQGFVVIALGKLGGGELNFSSDVDLVFAFDEHGASDGARPLDNELYFLRLSQRLIALLSDPVALVYRVDLRLRPFGESGRLALSLNATEQYYQHEGRDWERYAWIKARVCAGDAALGATLLDRLRPFVYRRYLDFTAVAGLRELKREIERKVSRDNNEDDLKLGRGGIREIEFIVQLEQLVRGGREPQLRTASLHAALAAQAQLKPERAPELDALKAHYALLRRVENRVQMTRDQQVHRLPDDAVERAAIARSLGFIDAHALDAALADTRAQVRAQFERVLKVRDEPPALIEPALSSALQPLLERAHALADGERLSPRMRGYFEQVLNALKRHAASAEVSTALAERVFKLLGALLKRGTYLALIAEQPLVLERLLTLAARSEWLIDAVRAQPLLLDELIDPRLFELEPLPALIHRLDARLKASDGDLEQDMDTLRQANAAQQFRVAAAYLDGRLDPATALAHLSAVADRLIERSAQLAVDSVARSQKLDPTALANGWIVVGYGSLGARELTVNSDLDLLFLLDDEVDSAPYRRIAQRLLHVLTTVTAAGRLFEVDTRLKPNGSAGQLVSTVAAFDRYQRESAWLWEHQALVHARVVAGAPALAGRFETVRADVLALPREASTVAAEIAAMHARLSALNDPRHAPNGPTAVKFAGEELVLANAMHYPTLTEPRSARDIFARAQALGLATRFSTLDAARVAAWRLEHALGISA